jgi:hypothetical protein
LRNYLTAGGFNFSWYQKIKPTVGIGPTTAGLQNQSSTVELLWHFRFILSFKLKQSTLLYIESVNFASEMMRNCCFSSKKSDLKLTRHAKTAIIKSEFGVYLC